MAAMRFHTGRRVRLYRENHPTRDGRMVRRSFWPNEPLPVLMVGILRNDFPAVVGSVGTIRREDEGWVTGRVYVPHYGITGLSAEADFDGGERSEDGGVMVVTGPQLRAVTLGSLPCWEGMEIREENEDEAE